MSLRDEGSSGAAPDELDRRLRLHVYECFAETGEAPAPLELSERFDLSPEAVGDILRRLEQEEAALVLLPGSSYLWMAEPFSAVPTLYPVRSGGDRWFGNCIWDALAILALLERDGHVETRSPVDGEPLHFTVREGELQSIDAVIHFAVPAREWWRSIGFT